MPNSSAPVGYRGSIFDFLANPAEASDPSRSYRYFPDGMLVVASQRIIAVGETSKIRERFPLSRVVDYSGHLITPGLIDCHIHYPQMEMIASYGEALLDWLTRYTFPTEQKFADPHHCQQIAELFIGELLRNGTTTALVMATSHPSSVEAVFAAAEKQDMRIISGLTMMDRHAPEALLVNPAKAREQSLQLISCWHGRKRLGYAIAPRFAITSSREGLRAARDLSQDCPALTIHTHLAENQREVREVTRLFPEAVSYFEIYERAGLATEKSVFAHAIHLEPPDYARLVATRSKIVHCPSSNLFLGSGLCNVGKFLRDGITVGLGSDVGAGTSFSLFKTMAEAYKVSTFHEDKFNPLQAFYTATLGGARCLGLDLVIGNFDEGKEADFIVTNFHATPLQTLRHQAASTFEDKLFALMMLGDDRNVTATYLNGRQAYP